MRIRSKATAVIAAASLASLGFAGTAFAQPTPPCDNDGVSCAGSTTVSGSAEVSQSISFSSTAVNFGPLTAVGQSSSPFNIYIGTNDPSGYTVWEYGPTAFAGAKTGNHYPFADSNFTAGTITNPGTGAQGTAPLSADLFSVVATAAVSGSDDFITAGETPPGDDSYPVTGWSLNTIPGNAPADTYSGQITMAAWGN